MARLTVIGAFSGAHASLPRKRATSPATVGPEFGKVAAAAAPMRSPKTTLELRNLGKTGYTEALGSVWYAIGWGFEKQKIFVVHSEWLD
jgi:hypothetical protein